jgi:hypothetical protein
VSFLRALAQLVAALFVYKGTTVIRRTVRGRPYSRRKHSDWS